MHIWLRHTPAKYTPSVNDFYPTLDFASSNKFEDNLNTYQVNIPSVDLAIIEKKALDYVHNLYIPYFAEKLASYNVFFRNPRSIYHIVYNWLSIAVQKFLICEYQLNILKTHHPIISHFPESLEIPVFQSYEDLSEFLGSSTSVALAYKFLLDDPVQIVNVGNESIQANSSELSRPCPSFWVKLTSRFMYKKEHPIIALIFSFIFTLFKSNQNNSSMINNLLPSSEPVRSDALHAFINSVAPVGLLMRTNIVIDSILSNYTFIPQHYRVYNHDLVSFEGAVMRALSSEFDERIVSIQHGSNYGTSMFIAQSDCTEYLSSIFISYGWLKHSEYLATVMPAKPSFRFKDMLSSSKNIYTSSILFIETCPMFSDFRINSYPIASSWLLYLQNKFHFFDSLSPCLKQHIVYRPHPASRDSRFTQLLQDEFAFKLSNEPIRDFLGTINRSNLLVFDHPSSLFLFCMKSNIPCLVYFDTSLFPVSEGFVSMLNELEKVSIFHRTAESASRHLSAIHESVEDWWRSQEVAAVKSNFVSNYANFSTSLLSTFFSYLNVFYPR